MIKLRNLSLIGVGVISLVGAALADPPKGDVPFERETGTGSRLSKRANTTVWNEAKMRQVQAEFGDCVIARQPTAARHFVLTANMEKADRKKDIDKVADGYCLAVVTAAMSDVQMKFPVDTMRYALAESLVRKEFAAAPAQMIKNASPLEQTKLIEADYQLEPGKKPRKGELEELQLDRQKQMALIYLSGFGECVVRADPASSHALLMTNVETPQELAVFKSLTPAFGGCLNTGESLAFNKLTLRGTIAMNYYRLAHAPKVAATTSTAAQ